jgi:hypothetical protein
MVAEVQGPIQDGADRPDYRAAEAANAVDPWRYDVLIDGRQVAPRA